MIYDEDKILLKRYRHIIAALIAYSIGYFTPKAALRAIQDYKTNQPNFCEWYLDIAFKRGVNNDEDFLAINRNVLKASIKYRHCHDFKVALHVVDKNIAGHSVLLGFKLEKQKATPKKRDLKLYSSIDFSFYFVFTRCY